MYVNSTVYPIYENKVESGYEYGFVIGNRKDKNSIFCNAGIITKVFKKKQNFKFLDPVECNICVKVNVDELPTSSNHQIYVSSDAISDFVINNNEEI